MASSSPAASLTGLFQPPPNSDLIETERTSLLTPKDSPLHASEVLVPIKREDDDALHQPPPETPKSTLLTSCQDLFTPDCLKSTCIGSFLFLLFHVVFCLAQASTITRPHATTPVVGPGTFENVYMRIALGISDMYIVIFLLKLHSNIIASGFVVAKMASLGILLGSPVFVFFLGQDIPAIYPTSDLFLAPFLANLAVTIDDSLFQHGLQDDNSLFLSTFTLVSSSGLLLSGILCVLAARFKLANLGAFLPYSVLCGFFSTIGILMWMLAFSVDTGGKKIGQLIMTGDWSLIGHSLVHHAPSLCIGGIMHVYGTTHPLFVVFLVLLSICGAYLVMLVTGTSLAAAQAAGWFYSSKDLVTDMNRSGKIGFLEWQPPAPFGILNSLLSGRIHWDSYYACLPTVLALAFLYVIRCSLHAAAVKKNIPNLTRKKSVDKHGEPPKAKNPIALQKIFERGYAYSQFVASFAGGIGVCPAGTSGKSCVFLCRFILIFSLSGRAVGVALTLFKMGAEGNAPQYGSFVLLAIFYLTDFQMVRFIPKPAFSCLLVLAFLDMVSVWFFGSYRKTKQKWEWMVAPLIMILSFVVGLLSAVVVGVTFSTIIFVGSFYKSGVVKYLANGLTLRSTIERGYRESVWLDQNGDLIQVLVLQNYLFFGNAQSLLAYLTTMFDVSDEESMHFQDLAIPLPPPPLFIIIDFTIVSGIDTSAIDLLREAVTLCKNNHCRLFISGMSHSLRSSVVYAGVKSDATFSFQPDLEAALGKAEDGILDSVFHVKEQTEHDVGVRRRERALSSADFGFRYALDKIDEQVSTSVWDCCSAPTIDLPFKL